MANIKSVAQKAGVNVSTVSRYVAGKLNVKKETREKIDAAIAELGYRPHATAKALKTSVTNCIGIVIPTIRNPLFADIVAGLTQRLEANKFTTMLYSTENHLSKEKEGIGTLLAGRVDGLVVVGSSGKTGSRDWLEEVKDIIPLVVVNRCWQNGDFNRVITDFTAGSRLAADYLVGKGYRRFAVITGYKDNEESQLKLYGFEQELWQRGIMLGQDMVAEGFFSYDKAYHAARKLLGYRPEAVFAASDLMAAAVLKATKDCGLVVPEDMAVIGYGDSQISQITTPALTTVAQHAVESGAAAANLLIEVMKEPGPAREVIMRTELVVRQST